jgi:carbon-monoxide dehydrogenase small subunit
LLTAQDLARKSPQASREEIREHIAGNLCRCTGYQAIVDAVESVMRKRCEAAADGNSRHD